MMEKKSESSCRAFSSSLNRSKPVCGIRAILPTYAPRSDGILGKIIIDPDGGIHRSNFGKYDLSVWPEC
jgi:hypothetical protein